MTDTTHLLSDSLSSIQGSIPILSPSSSSVSLHDISPLYYSYSPPRWSKLCSLRASLRYFQFLLSIASIAMIIYREQNHIITFLFVLVAFSCFAVWSILAVISYLIRHRWPFLFRYANLCESTADTVLLASLGSCALLPIYKSIASDIALAAYIICVSNLIFFILHVKTAGKAEETMAQSYITLSHSAGHHDKALLLSIGGGSGSLDALGSSSLSFSSPLVPTPSHRSPTYHSNHHQQQQQPTATPKTITPSTTSSSSSSTANPHILMEESPQPADYFGLRMKSRALMRRLQHHPLFQYDQLLSVRGFVYMLGSILSFVLVTVLSHINEKHLDVYFTVDIHIGLMVFHIIHMSWCLFALGMTVARQFTAIYACYTNLLFYLFNLGTHVIALFTFIFLLLHYTWWKHPASHLYLAMVISQGVITIAHIYTSQWACRECLLSKELQQLNAATGVSNLDLDLEGLAYHAPTTNVASNPSSMPFV